VANRGQARSEWQKMGERQMATFDISVIGELNLDIIFYGLPTTFQLDQEHLANDLSITLGSSSAIFAHNLALLGNKVGFSSSIGGDPLGEICLERLAGSGVDVSRVSRMGEKTTGLSVILMQDKKRYILTYPGTMYEMRRGDLDLSYVLNAKHLHLSSYFLQKSMQTDLPEIYREAKKAGLTTSLDTNGAPENRWPEDLSQLLKHVDILLLNEDEACGMAGTEDVHEAIEKLSTRVAMLVVKIGSRGAEARVGKTKYSAPPLTVEAVDSVGAGDSFDAGFLHQFIRGENVQNCLEFGNLTGALSVTRSGGTEAFKDAEWRESFLRKNKQTSPARS
jgi:sugar/nucleoside kinase (ribokinase family)